MRRPPTSLAALLVLLAPSTALAADHLAKISEVMLSTNGDGTAQFVEIVTAAEPYANDPYGIEVYDADANLIDTVTFDMAGNDTIYVASATAVTELLEPADVLLDITLPTDGQVCLIRDVGSNIHCIAWGCVNTLAGSASQTSTGPSPADGESLQRQSTGEYHLAAPTPDAANVAGTLAPACATAPDAGVPPDADPNAPDAAANAPDASGGGGGDDDGGGGGCCQSSRDRGAAGSIGLALFGLAALGRRRRRATRR